VVVLYFMFFLKTLHVLNILKELQKASSVGMILQTLHG